MAFGCPLLLSVCSAIIYFVEYFLSHKFILLSFFSNVLFIARILERNHQYPSPDWLGNITAKTQQKSPPRPQKVCHPWRILSVSCAVHGEGEREGVTWPRTWLGYPPILVLAVGVPWPNTRLGYSSPRKGPGTRDWGTPIYPPTPGKDLGPEARKTPATRELGTPLPHFVRGRYWLKYTLMSHLGQQQTIHCWKVWVN